MRLVSGIIETIVMSHGDEVGVGDNRNHSDESW